MSINKSKLFIKKFILALLLIYAFVFGIYTYGNSFVSQSGDKPGILPKSSLYLPPPKDYVTKWEHDIVSLKQKIPVGQARLGYLADWDLHPDADQPDQYIFYYLAQYSLAPAIIDRGTDAEWIILYTSDPKPGAWLNAHIKKYSIEPAGYRFFLIHQAMSK